MASIALQLAAPTPSNFGMMNSTTVHFTPVNDSNNNTSNNSNNNDVHLSAYEVNLQQVGEEVEGIVMLSLLKQKLESFSEIIRQKNSVFRAGFDVVEQQRDSDEETISNAFGRGKRRTSSNGSNSAAVSYHQTIAASLSYSSTPSSPKRRRDVKREEESLEISSRNSWMENFGTVKRLSQMTDAERRPIETIQMNEWIEQQQSLFNRRTLSEERIELLRMIGVDLENNTVDHHASSSSSSSSHNNHHHHHDRASSPDPTWDDDYDDLSSSGKEQSPPLRKKRRSPPISLPASPAHAILIPSSSSSSSSSSSNNLLEKQRKKIPGKKKANLKRNSLHNWVYNQRRLQYEGNLPVHRKKLLDKIGFDWKWVQQKIDEERALLLQQQGLTLDGTNGSNSSMNSIASSPAVSSPQQPSMMAMGEENNNEGDAPSEPIPNSKSEELWMTRYRELIEFKERHGNYEVPRYVE